MGIKGLVETEHWRTRRESIKAKQCFDQFARFNPLNSIGSVGHIVYKEIKGKKKSHPVKDDSF